MPLSGARFPFFLYLVFFLSPLLVSFANASIQTIIDNEVSESIMSLKKEYKELSCDLPLDPFIDVALHRQMLEECRKPFGCTIEDNYDQRYEDAADIVPDLGFEVDDRFSEMNSSKKIIEGLVLKEEEDDGYKAKNKATVTIENNLQDDVKLQIWNPASALKGYKDLFNRITSSKDRLRAFGNDVVLPLFWESVWMNTRESLSLPLAQPDLSAWKDFYTAANFEQRHFSECSDPLNNPCACLDVLCSPDKRNPPKENRIIGIVPPYSALEAVDLPSSFGSLDQLQVFVARRIVLGAIPASFLSLQALRILELFFSPSASFESNINAGALPKVQANSFSHLESLALSSSYKTAGNSVHFSKYANISLLQPFCSARNIKMLTLFNLKGELPSCIGEMKSMVHLVLGALQFNQPTPLPQWLAKLTELKVFYSFYSGETVCPSQEEAAQCKVKYITRTDFDIDGKPWQCPSHGFVGKIPDSYKLLTKMEKFWVDANFLEGAIPAWIGTHWKNLRSLDLFDNKFSGPIPSSFGSLKKLELLQIQSNQLSGEFPSSILLLPRLHLVNVGENAGLRGCAGRATNPRLKFLYAGSQIRYNSSAICPNSKTGLLSVAGLQSPNTVRAATSGAAVNSFVDASIDISIKRLNSAQIRHDKETVSETPHRSDLINPAGVKLGVSLLIESNGNKPSSRTLVTSSADVQLNDFASSSSLESTSTSVESDVPFQLSERFIIGFYFYFSLFALCLAFYYIFKLILLKQ